MQTFGTKKSRNLLGQKKITQPLGGKNHATSQDKKKSRNFLGQKKSCNLSGQKIKKPLRQKKIRNLPISPIAFKLVHKAPNCSKWHQIGQNGSK